MVQAKPEYQDWSEIEMFACLKNNNLISKREQFEYWSHRRADMLQKLEDFFEN